MIFLSDREIESTYEMIKEKHSRFLERHGVILPHLRKKGEYTRSGIVLVYLAHGYPNTEVYSKKRLTDVINHHFGNAIDVQQARHLGAQNGLYIINGDSRTTVYSLNNGEYKLISLEEPIPGFTIRRPQFVGDWDKIKNRYDYKCATCGSEEGKPHRYFRTITVHLQKGHMDPNKPLTEDNVIPQCQVCNKPDQNRWKYDANGRVIGIASIAPIINVLNENEKISKDTYKELFKKYSGVNPKNW